MCKDLIEVAMGATADAFLLTWASKLAGLDSDETQRASIGLMRDFRQFREARIDQFCASPESRTLSTVTWLVVLGLGVVLTIAYLENRRP